MPKTMTKAPRTLTLLERKAYRDAYRGKVLLDAANERWPEKIDRLKLNMGTPRGPCGCVLAQWMYEPEAERPLDYWDGLIEVGIATTYSDSRMRNEAHYGFNDGYVPNLTKRHSNVHNFNHLQRAWTYILRKLGR